MKKMISTLLISFLAVWQVSSAELAANDTTFRYKGKIIQVEDSTGKVKVKVFDESKKDSTAYKQLYEGIYTEEKSFEKWMVIEEVGLQLPFLNKVNEKHRHKNRTYSMEPHWAGVGMGFVNIANSSLRMNDIDHMTIKAENSNQWFFNIIEKILPIYRNNLGLTTGLGFSWTRYYLDNNTHLVENNSGKTEVLPANIGVKYDYSMLRVASMDIPLFLEWQPTIGNNHKLFVTLGVIGGINLRSSMRVKYQDSNNKNIKEVEDRGLNTTPISLHYMAQFGYKSWSVYAKYSPFSVFQSNKGPKVHMVSLGLMLGF